MTNVTSFQAAGVTGFLHRPDGGVRAGMVLTHGAGSNCEAPLLVAAANAFSALGVCVLRCDLWFRQQRPSGPPPRGSAAADRAGLQAAATALREIVTGKLFLAGHSYGGRQASMLAADERAIADGLLLLSYPLHPPTKPTQLRTEHLPRLHVPALFVHGTADPFGSVEELRAAASLVPAPTMVIPIPGSGHDLKRGRIDFAPVAAALFTLGDR
jgi:predicted alpha/beta-hydrolase family hydrolase